VKVGETRTSEWPAPRHPAAAECCYMSERGSRQQCTHSAPCCAPPAAVTSEPPPPSSGPDLDDDVERAGDGTGWTGAGRVEHGLTWPIVQVSCSCVERREGGRRDRGRLWFVRSTRQPRPPASRLFSNAKAHRYTHSCTLRGYVHRTSRLSRSHRQPAPRAAGSPCRRSLLPGSAPASPPRPRPGGPTPPRRAPRRRTRPRRGTCPARRQTRRRARSRPCCCASSRRAARAECPSPRRARRRRATATCAGAAGARC